MNQTKRTCGKRQIGPPPMQLETLEPRHLLSGRPVISEFMARNDSTLTDGDGQYSDWIEIYNAGDEAIDLLGYRLTDKSDDLSRWSFPSVILEPGEPIVVFASGKDSDDYVDPAGSLHTNFALKAQGEFLALVAPDGRVVSRVGPELETYPPQFEDVSFGVPQAVVLVNGSSPSTYRVPMDDTVDAEWSHVDFDSRSHGFEPGRAAVGLENRPQDRVNFTDQIQTPLPSRAHAVYSRIEFDLHDVSSVQRLILRMQVDNGFVAYLNGVEVARDNAPDDPNWFAVAPFATRSDSQVLEFADFDISAHTGQLVAGRNVLAIHGMNAWQDDSDMLIVPELIAAVTPRDGLEKWGYMTTPTPGRTNGRDDEVFAGFVSEVHVSDARGFYDLPTSVSISTETPGARIRYTTDGSPPTESHGTVYTEPLSIDRTTTLRAIALKDGFAPSDTITQSYVFLDDVVSQGDVPPPGYPQSWGPGVTDWGLDQDPDDIKAIAGDPGWSLEQARDEIKDSLRSLPTLSLVMDREDLFGLERGIYTHPQQSGMDWERAVSMELIDPEDHRTDYQVDAGIRIQGFTSRDPNRNPKHSLRLVFRREYGDTKLRVPFFGPDGAAEFDTLVLRSNSQDAWVYDTADNRRGQFIRDQWARETQLAMGQPSPRGNWVHLYLNGLYWGLYNPTERPDASFNAAYFGGDKEDYDSLKNHEEVVDGNGDAYQELLALIQNNPRSFAAGYRDLSGDADYQRILGNNPDGSPNPDYPRYVDEVNLIDYVIHNMYAAANDWPGNNYIGRNRNPDSDGFRFFDWDNEHGMKPGVTTDRTLPHSRDADSPTKFHHAFRANAEYRMRFADRLHRAFFNGGPLYVDPANPEPDPAHPERNVPAGRWMRVTGEIERALIAEAARWGDVRGIQYTPHDQFQDLRDQLLTTWFPRRSQIVLDQFRRQGLYPDVVAPSFSQHGGLIDASTEITMWAPQGSVYYTTDGSDPRSMGGGVSPNAIPYSGPLRLSQTATVKSRVLRDGQWSALNEADFTIPSDLPLRITEVNYHPHPAPSVPGNDELNVDNDQFEFVELMNTSDHSMDLAGVGLYEKHVDRPTAVLKFQFAPQSLAPNQRLVVVRNRDAFASRYGPSIRVAAGNDGNGGRDGEFRGNLSNWGQGLMLVDAGQEIVQEVWYGAGGAWPERANGQGSSLELTRMDAAARRPEDWFASREFAGSPGAASSQEGPGIVINEILPNPDAGKDQAVEVHNRSDLPIDMGGWYWSHAGSNYFEYQIPEPTVVAPGGYAELPISALGLDGVRGDQLRLIAIEATGRSARFVDQVRFGPTLPGSTVGPWQGSSDSGWFVPLAVPTLGAANSSVRISDVVISEIHHNPVDPDGPDRLRAEDFQFVELYNRTDASVDLTDWRLDGSVTFDFPPGTRIEADQTLVVVPFATTDRSDELVFRFHFAVDSSTRLMGPFDGRLEADEGVVQLQRAVSTLAGRPADDVFAVVDSVPYGNSPPWPAGDMAGRSLNRGPLWGFGPLGQNWSRAAPSPGTVSPSVPIIGDSTADGVFDRWDIVHVLQAGTFQSGRPATNSEGDWNGDGFFDRIDLIFALQANTFHSISGTRRDD